MTSVNGAVVEQLLDHLDPCGEAHGVGLAELTEVDDRRRRRVVRVARRRGEPCRGVGWRAARRAGRRARDDADRGGSSPPPRSPPGAATTPGDEAVGGRVVGVSRNVSSTTRPTWSLSRSPTPAVSTPERSSNAGVWIAPAAHTTRSAAITSPSAVTTPVARRCSEPDRGHDAVGDHVEVRPRHRRIEVRVARCSTG